MNQNNTNNILDQNEIKSKLQNFQEGKDYFVTPTQEAKIKDYTFFNDRLKSLFGGNNWVPVRVWQEKYEDKNMSYRGHFEEGRDYYYSAQYWDYRKGVEKDYQETHYPKPLLNDLKKWQEERFRNIKLYSEGGKFEGGKLVKHWESKEIWYTELKSKHNSLVAKLNSLLLKSENEFGVNGKAKKEAEIIEVKKDIADTEKLIEKEKNQRTDELAAKPGDCCLCGRVISRDADAVWHNRGLRGNYLLCSSECKEKFSKHDFEDKYPAGCCNCGFRDMGPSDKYCQMCGAEFCDKAKSGKVDLEKENFELRQQLASVQAELAKVLAELKKLTGKNEALDKLEQQQARNEKAMVKGSVSEIKEQVFKSQALVQEASVNTMSTTAPGSKNEPKNGVLPYLVVGGSLVAGLGVIALCWKKRSKK